LEHISPFIVPNSKLYGNIDTQYCYKFFRFQLFCYLKIYFLVAGGGSFFLVSFYGIRRERGMQQPTIFNLRLSSCVLFCVLEYNNKSFKTSITFLWVDVFLKKVRYASFAIFRVMSIKGIIWVQNVLLSRTSQSKVDFSRKDIAQKMKIFLFIHTKYFNHRGVKNIGIDNSNSHTISSRFLFHPLPLLCLNTTTLFYILFLYMMMHTHSDTCNFWAWVGTQIHMCDGE